VDGMDNMLVLLSVADFEGRHGGLLVAVAEMGGVRERRWGAERCWELLCCCWTGREGRPEWGHVTSCELG
jgi:hypothetical protein